MTLLFRPILRVMRGLKVGRRAVEALRYVMEERGSASPLPKAG